MANFLEGLNGAAMMVQGSTVLVEAAGGLADAESAVPCTVETSFQIASMSKQFTAAAALLLVQDGELELTDPISRWITWGPPRWREITVHHLLSHTSGLGQWWAVPGFEDLSKAWPADEYLRRLAEIPLLSAPGETFSYSSPGFLMAAKIVGAIAAEPYPSFLARRIFEPLAMNSTTSTSTPAGPVARGHAGGERTPEIPDLAEQQGTGDIWSTVGDLTRYIRALGAGDLLDQDRLRAMVTAHASVDDPQWRMGPMAGTGYGYGMGLGTFGRAPIRFHGGDNPGYRSFFIWAPEADLVLSVLCNDEAANVPALTLQILSTALEH